MSPGVTPAVTVVVPVYNVEAYLLECLESLAAQTFRHVMRVIVVDDGSTDQSGIIAGRFVADHPTFRLITRNNGGLGAARNTGLAHVATPYVMFCDSDDRLPPDAVRHLLEAMESSDAAVAIGRMRTFPQVTTWPWSVHLQQARIIDGIEDAPELIHGASACNKMFRTQLLTEQNLRFAEGSHFEDVYVTIPVLLRANRIALVPELVYEYRKRDAGTSIMDSIWRREDNFWDHLRAAEQLSRLRPQLSVGRRHALEQFLVRSMQGFLVRAPQALPAARLPEFFARCRTVYRDVDPAHVVAATLDVRHRRPFLAVLANDFVGYADPTARPLTLRIHAGHAALDTLPAMPRRLQPLLTPDRVRAEVTGVTAEVDGVAVHGRFNLGGLAPTNLDLDISVRVRGSRVTVPDDRSRRRLRVGRQAQAPSWVEFVAVVPAQRLREGLSDLRIVLGDKRESVSARMKPTLGLLRARRTLTLPGRKVLVEVGQHGQLQLRVDRIRGRRDRIGWQLALLTDDLRQVAQRQPLASLRLVRALTRPWFRRPIWLLTERGDTAQDNSTALFRHLRQKHRDIAAYFVIDKRSSQTSGLRGLDHIIARNSWRHRLLMLHAQWLIGSYDIDAYLLPSRWNRGSYLKHVAWRVGSRRAFLQHGVIYNDVGQALQRGVTGLDVFVTSSAREAEAVRSTTGYEREVVVTGLPRFDTLTPDRRGNTILLMPTWRTWLASPSYLSQQRAKEVFAGSQYEQFFRTFIDDPTLAELLEEHDARLEVLPHYEFVDFFTSLVRRHHRVILSTHRDRDVQRAIREASLVVTDWSSTFFDAAYLSLPVVLMPFDEDRFRAEHYPAGYFDVRRDGFGPVTTTPAQAVEAIRRYAERGFTREPEYGERAARFFAYRDQSSSARVVSQLRDSGNVPAGNRRPDGGEPFHNNPVQA